MGNAADNFFHGSRLITGGASRACLALGTIQEELSGGRPDLSEGSGVALAEGIRDLVAGRSLIDSELAQGVVRELGSELSQVREMIRVSVGALDRTLASKIVDAARDPGAGPALQGVSAQLELLDEILGGLERSVLTLEQLSSSAMRRGDEASDDDATI